MMKTIKPQMFRWRADASNHGSTMSMSNECQENGIFVESDKNYFEANKKLSLQFYKFNCIL